MSVSSFFEYLEIFLDSPSDDTFNNVSTTSKGLHEYYAQDSESFIQAARPVVNMFYTNGNNGKTLDQFHEACSSTTASNGDEKDVESLLKILQPSA